jgi:hypothetical protein
MYIYLLDIKFKLDNSFSLKDKRKVIRSIIDYARNYLKISSAELTDNDMINFAHLGFVTISNNNNKAKSILEKLVYRIETNYCVEITDYYIERI